MTTEQAKASFVVYKDRKEEWRWRLVAHNGRTICDSAESYKELRGVMNGLRCVARNATDAIVRVLK